MEQTRLTFFKNILKDHYYTKRENLISDITSCLIVLMVA